MRTLDEEIAHQREVAEKIRTEHNCECDYYDIGIDCVKCAEEHEQIAEWLEELKDLREMRDAIESNANTLEQNGYNKAIDDFAEKLIRYVDCGHLCSPTEVRWSDLSVVEMVNKLAEQLKVGVNNE